MRGFWRGLTATLVALAASSAVLAQGAIQQSGPVTFGHVPVWFSNGVVGDGGGASGNGPVRDFGVVGQGSGSAPYINSGTGPLGSNLCAYDAPSNSANGYHYLCLNPNNGAGGVISYGAGGIAAQLPLYININGVTSQLPGSVPVPLVIRPPSGTFTQGFNVLQTGPTAASFVGPLAYNQITVNHYSTTTGSSQTATALGVNFNVGGANLAGQPMAAGFFATTANLAGMTQVADKIGLIGASTADVSDTSGSGYYGLNAVTSIATGVSVNRAVGFESDVIINNAATATYRYAVSAVSEGPGTGSTLDSAFFIGNINGSAVGGFKHGLTLSQSLGQAPLDSGGDLIFADTPQTLANVINLPTMTVTGDIFNFNNAVLTGQGQLTLANGYVATGGPSSMPTSGQGAFYASANSGAVVQGHGAVFDFNLNNAATQNVCAVSTGTRTFACNQLEAAGSLKLDGSSTGSLLLQAPATASGTLTLPAGTTNFSATGGASQVVQQTSSGGALTVGQLATSNLSDVTAPTTWTPSDQSGATLTFTAVTALYTKVGKALTAQVRLTYPSTASGSSATVGGLPSSSATSGATFASGNCWSNAGGGNSLLTPLMTANSTQFTMGNAAGSSATNANLSTSVLTCTLNYVTN